MLLENVITFVGRLQMLMSFLSKMQVAVFQQVLVRDSALRWRLHAVVGLLAKAYVAL